MNSACESPIFIIGNPRSGTTLLRLMLTCHPKVVIPPECGFAVWWYDKYREWQINPDDPGAIIEAFHSDVVSSRKFETWDVDHNGLLRFLQDRQPKSYASAVSWVYCWYGMSRQKGNCRWGDKNNFYISHIPTISRMYPKCVFVHIVRDGRDVACSYRELAARAIESLYAPQLSAQIESIACEWSENLRAAREAFDTMTRDRVVEIRFEELIRDTQAVLTLICENIGEEYSSAMLDYPRRNVEDNLEPESFMAWKTRTSHPPLTDRIERFRSELSDEEIAAFNTVGGKMLSRYGYPVGDQNPGSTRPATP